MPHRLIQHPLPDNPGLAQVLLQHNAIALGILLLRGARFCFIVDVMVRQALFQPVRCTLGTLF